MEGKHLPRGVRAHSARKSSEVIADVLKYVGTIEYQLPKSVFNGKNSFEKLDKSLTAGARK